MNKSFAIMLNTVRMFSIFTSDANNPKCLNQYDIRLYEDYPSCGGTWPHELPLMKQYLDVSASPKSIEETQIL